MDNKSQLPNNDSSTPYKQERQTNMTEISTLIDSKIETAKLVICEKRFNYLLSLSGAALAIFGIFLPFYLAYQNSERVDKSIERMDNNFKELEGRQMRKPALSCFVDGKILEESTIIFSRNNKNKIIEIKNTGDWTASDFKCYLYIKMPRGVSLGQRFLYDWEPIENNDESLAYDLKMELLIPNDYKLPAKDLFHIKLEPNFNNINNGDIQVSVLLKIFYGESEPKNIPFYIKYVSK
jgi:hypothetical protein